MKLVKSLLLGSAAGLVAVAGASAADLGVKKPTAVEYVKTCPTYGAGFFVVPGTTSCLKLIGRVRLDARIDAPVTRNGHKSVMRARGYVGFDHRTATEYGLLRTYVRAYIQMNSGALSASGNSSTPSGVNLEYAFIQFGGLTVGRVAPAFEHGWSQWYLTSGGNMAGGYHSDASYVNSIGYTANFGGGFSATIALDDATDRHNYGAQGGWGSLALPTPAFGGPRAGHSMPDLVGSIAYDQSWGSFKLSGALTQHRYNYAAGTFTPNGGLAAAHTLAGKSTQYGYAVEAGVKINLPFLTKGSNFWMSGSYSKGAINYVGYNVWGGTSVGGVTYNTSDFNGAGALSTAFSVIGALQVYATPTIAVSVGAAYGSYNPAGANNTINGLTVLGQVQWMPVAGFLIGSEVAYRSLTASTGLIPAGTKKNDVVGRIRFQRDF